MAAISFGLAPVRSAPSIFKRSAACRCLYPLWFIGPPFLGTQKDGVVSFTGNPASSSFSATIDKLESGKTYYVRAYANNGVNTTYGEVLKVTTLGGKPENGDNPDPSL